MFIEILAVSLTPLFSAWAGRGPGELGNEMTERAGRLSKRCAYFSSHFHKDSI